MILRLLISISALTFVTRIIMRQNILLLLLFFLASCQSDLDKNEVERSNTIKSTEKIEGISNIEVSEKIDVSQIEKPIQKQKRKYAKRKYRTIASTGLNLRTEPKLSSETILKIPYFDEVQVVDENSFGSDTLNLKKNENGELVSKIGNNIIGDWVKVKYENQVGYVFSAYIMRGENSYTGRPKGLNKKYGLHFTGENCVLLLYCFHFVGMKCLM